MCTQKFVTGSLIGTVSTLYLLVHTCHSVSRLMKQTIFYQSKISYFFLLANTALEKILKVMQTFILPALFLMQLIIFLSLCPTIFVSFFSFFSRRRVFHFRLMHRVPSWALQFGAQLNRPCFFWILLSKSHQYVVLKTENMTMEDYTVFVFNFEDT